MDCHTSIRKILPIVISSLLTYKCPTIITLNYTVIGFKSHFLKIPLSANWQISVTVEVKQFKRLLSVTMLQLKLVGAHSCTWQGMVFFMLLNPDLSYPFDLDLKGKRFKKGEWKEVLKGKTKKKEMPSHSKKYQINQATGWSFWVSFWMPLESVFHSQPVTDQQTNSSKRL